MFGTETMVGACFVALKNHDDGLFLFFAFYSLKTNNSIRYMTTESLQSDYSKDWFNLMKLCYSHATHRSENINCILKHKNFSMQHVINNPDLPWDWSLVNSHEKLEIEHIKQNKTLPWDWIHLSRNLNTQNIIDNPDLPWDWHEVSLCTSGINIIEENPDLPWDWRVICCKSVTIDFILKMNEKQKPIIWDILSSNGFLKLNDILTHQHLPWNWKIVCNKRTHGYYDGRCEVSQQTIMANSHLPWKTDMLGCCGNPFSFKFVLENPDADWNWKWLHICYDLKPIHVLQYSEKDWNWKGLSRAFYNVYSDNDFLFELSDKDWDWSLMSKWKNLPIDVVIKLPEKDWDWSLLSEHPNLTMKCVLELKDKPWNWRVIRNRNFEK